MSFAATNTPQQEHPTFHLHRNKKSTDTLPNTVVRPGRESWPRRVLVLEARDEAELKGGLLYHSGQVTSPDFEHGTLSIGGHLQSKSTRDDERKGMRTARKALKARTEADMREEPRLCDL